MARDWRTDVLKELGAPVTPNNLRFLNAWQQAEGTRARHNPLATTHGYPGSGNFNSVGVKNYPSYEAGVYATVRTLQNGRYEPIVDGLRDGRVAPLELGRRVAASPWGTGQGVVRVLGGASPSRQGGAALTAATTVNAGAPPTITARPAVGLANPLVQQVLASNNAILGVPTPPSLFSLAAAPGQVTTSAPLAPTGGANQPALGALPQGLDPAFAASINRLIADSKGRVWSESGWRSYDHQKRLFEAAVKKYGSVEAARKWVAPPGLSQHNTGMADDLGGDLDWAHQNAARYGIQFPMSWEKWHAEPVGSR